MDAGEFNKRSKAHCANLHFDLQRVLKLTRKRFAFEIICSHRGKDDQEAAFKRGASKAHYGESPHNFVPACAADLIPSPLDWNDKKSFENMMAEVQKTAAQLGVPVRIGMDWDRDGKLWEKGENDGPHVELHPWREYAQVHAGKT